MTNMQWRHIRNDLLAGAATVAVALVVIGGAAYFLGGL